MKVRKIVTCAVLLLLLVAAATGCRGAATPTPTPTPEPLPSGWMLHTAHKFEIGLPADWIALEVSAEVIDAVIEVIQPSNPEFVPYLEALKHQESVKFWAFDPTSPPSFAININVGYGPRLIKSLEQYAELIKKQVEPLGFTVVIGDKFSLRAYEALRFQSSGMVYYASDEPLRVEQQMVIIDHEGDRFEIALSYPPEEARKYKELFDSIIRTFDIVK